MRQGKRTDWIYLEKLAIYSPKLAETIYKNVIIIFFQVSLHRPTPAAYWEKNLLISVTFTGWQKVFIIKIKWHN